MVKRILMALTALILTTTAAAHQPNSVGVVASETTAGVSLGLHDGFVISVQHAENDNLEQGIKVGVAKPVLDLGFATVDLGISHRHVYDTGDDMDSGGDNDLSIGVGLSTRLGNYAVGVMYSQANGQFTESSDVLLKRLTFGLSRRF